MDNNKIKLGVLWKHLSREGNKPYLSGRVQQDSLDAAVELLRGGGRFLVLSSKKRPNKQDPDCELFVVPDPEGREGRGTAAAAATTPPQAVRGPDTQRTSAAARPRR